MNLTHYLADKKVLAGTGSRSFEELTPKTPVLGRLDRFLTAAQAKHGDKLVVMSGGALGWDRWLALTAYDLAIPYVLCLPNRGYGAYYYRQHPDWFEAMRARAAAIEYTMEEVHQTTSLYLNGEHSNFVRNRRMVALADAFVVYLPTSPGTRHCLGLIKAAGLPWRDLT